MLLHATCVALNNRAVLLTGKSGCGKSDLGLRLIECGAVLVSDDQTLLQKAQNHVTASPPAVLAGMIEIRHVGLLRLPFVAAVAVALYIELTAIEAPLARLPERDAIFLLDHPVPRLRLPAFAASTPAKIRAFLTHSNDE